MRTRGFYFETRNGSPYYYDDLNGFVTVEETGKRKGRDDSQKSLAECLSASAELSRLFEPGHKDRVVGEIKRYLEVDGYKQMVLIVTEDCNLRCKYCIYSGNYQNMRVHQPVYMSWEVAREAIKWYLDRIRHTKESNPRKVPVIGFYGGEPLMCLELIKQAVMYARALYPREITFNLTTNGTLLCGEVADFLANNRFNVTITLNGPQTEHDRLRVFPDGSGSFDIIWNCLSELREKYPDFYKKNCNFNVDYDAGTELNLVRSFFEERDEIRSHSAIPRGILGSFTKWHERYSVDQHRKHLDLLEACKQTYFSEALKERRSSAFLFGLVGLTYSMILTRPQESLPHPSFLPYTATCIPGDKIAVDPHGNFHCCEKMNKDFPIGNIDVGLDMESITKMVEMYQKEIFPACVDCPITRLCPVCYATVAGMGKFERNPPDLCDGFQRNARQVLAELWSALESGARETAIAEGMINLSPGSCRKGG